MPNPNLHQTQTEDRDSSFVSTSYSTMTSGLAYHRLSFEVSIHKHLKV